MNDDAHGPVGTGDVRHGRTMFTWSF